MKVGITGGTGLIGRTLAHRLLQTGNFVRIFSRSSDIPSLLRGQRNLEIVAGSFPKSKDLQGLDAIVNLAGFPIAGVRWTEKVKQEIRSSRVDYTKNLAASLQTVAGTPPEVLIQGSAVGYYGSYEDDTNTFSEESPLGSDSLATLCADWEAAAQPVTNAGIRLVKIRTGVVLSPFGGALKSMLSPFRLGMGGPIGSGKQILSWIHIEDMVSAILHLIENKELSGAFNLVSPHPVNNETFTKTLASVLRRPAFFRVPASVLKFLFEEGADVILQGQTVVPQRLSKSGFTFRYPNLEDALRELLHAHS
ncbi:TIGR01777 family protein [Leptospira yasudae]|uniref:TIGR01777 family oxidoreductase n=1 Tax=Leptospira yasudae TaxID=2202201 RepID=UPI001C4EAA21|nr:TIGR01777 family oxidoreductase [Leptospira yasudae]MBW0432636.1 TIGR01777 family protein [Leptospira yasudae]